MKIKLKFQRRGFVIVCELLILTTLMAILLTLLIVSEVTQRTVKDIATITNNIPSPDFNIRHKLWNVGKPTKEGLITVDIPEEELAMVGQWRIYRTLLLKGTNTVWTPIASDYCDRLSAKILLDKCRDFSLMLDEQPQAFFKAEKDEQP